MSTTIDQRVVEMRFDNKHFENNVSTTMSTLDKLKQKLNLDGATRGLENINNATKNVKMDGLASAVENVSMKFSALQVMGVTALANITNKAVDAGERLVKSLSVDQIMAGWNKYGQKTSSVQTIMNATGLEIEEVNKYLDKLMWFSDETSYGFTDMTAALGQMTSAGGDIKKLIPLITGVANATAFAGKGASEFSRVMYNLNQSYGAGYLQYMDWRSIDLAGVSSKQLKQTFIDVGEELGKIKKGTITVADFANTLKDRWADTEVMEAAFGRFAEMSEKAYEMVKAGEVDTASKAYEILSEQYDGVAITAAKAAQEAKTFSEAIDATKDAVSSGWMKTFELIFGDYVQAKELWTGLANVLWDVFASGAEVRNWIVEAALNFSKPWSDVAEKLGTVKKAINKVKDATKTLTEFQSAVSDVWMGKYKNVDTGRFDLLTQAGFDPRVVQDLVNKGSDYKLTIDDIQASHEKFGLTLEENVEETEILTKALENLSEEELRNAGLTDEEIELYQALAKEAKRTGQSMDSLIEKMSNMDGRTLLIESIKNAWTGLTNVADAIKQAWINIFNPPTNGELVVKLYNIIDAIHTFSKKLTLVDEKTGELTETADKFRRIFEGVFAVIHSITTILNGGFKIAFEVLKGVLEYFNIDLLGVLARVGDGFVRFSDDVDKVVTTITETIVGGITDWIEKFRETEVFKTIAQWFQDAGTSISNTFDNISNHVSNFNSSMVGQGLQAFAGFVTSIGSSIANSDIFQTVVDGICSAFEKIKGFFSRFKLPKFDFSWFTNLFKNFGNIEDKIASVDAGGIGKTLTGFGLHLKDNVLSFNWSTFKNNTVVKFTQFWLSFGEKIKAGFVKCKEALLAIKEFIFGSEDITLPAILSLAEKFLGIAVLLQALKTIQSLTSPFDGIADALNNLASSFKWKAISSAFKSMALALGVFAVCILVLTQIEDQNAAWGAVKMLSILMGVMAGVVLAMGFLASKAQALSASGAAAALLMIVASIALLVYAIRELDDLELKDPERTFNMLAAILLSMVVAVSTIAKAGGIGFKSIAAIATLLIALKELLGVIEAYDKFDWVGKSDAIKKMMNMMVALALAVNISTRGVKPSASGAGLALLMLSLVLSLRLLLKAIKEYAEVPEETIYKGGKVVVALLAVMTFMAVALNYANKGNVLSKGQKMGNSFAGMAAALIVAIGAIWILGKMAQKDPNTLMKGGQAVAQILLTFSAMMFAVGKACSGLSTGPLIVALIGMGALMALMARILYQMQDVPIEGSIGTAAALGGLMLAMAGAFRLLSAKDVKAKTVFKWVLALTALTALMAVLAGLLYAMREVPAQSALGSAAALTTLLGAMVGVLYLLTGLDMRKLSANKMDKLYPIFTRMVGLLAGLGLVLALMSGLGTNGAVTNAAGLSIVLGAMIGVLYLIMGLDMRSLNENKMTKLYSVFIRMVGLMAGLGLILALMSGLNTTNAVTNATALTILLGALSGVMFVLSMVKADNKIYTGVMAMLALTAPLFVLATILSDMSGVQNAIANATALSLLAGALSLCMVAISFAGKIDIANLAFGVIGMLAIAVVLADLATVLTAMDGIQNAIANATALSLLAGALSLCMIAIGFAGKIDIGGLLVSVIGMAVIASVLSKLAQTLIAMDGIQNGIQNAAALSILLIAMSVVYAILSKVGTGVGTAIMGALGLMGVIAVIGACAMAIGGLMSLIPQETIDKWKTGLENFLDFLRILTYGLGEIVGSLIGGLLAGITGLPAFGEDLRAFAESMDGIKPEMFYGIEALCSALLSLTGANLLNGLADLFGGKGSLATFGESVKSFGACIKECAEVLKDITDDDVANVKKASEAGLALAELNKSIPRKDGWLQDFLGEQDLAAFGTSIMAFADCLIEYSKKVSGQAIDKAAIENSAAAATSLAELNKQLPRDGGDLQDIIGSKDLSAWGEKIVAFAECLIAYSDVITGSNIDCAAIENSAAAALKLAEVNDAIPLEGGAWQAIAGGKDLTAFSAAIVSLGAGLASYATSVSAVDDTAIANIERSGIAVEKLKEVLEKVPDETGWFGKLFKSSESNDGASFASAIISLATALRDYSAVSAELASTNAVENVESTKNVVTALDEVLALVPSGDKIGNARNLVTAFTSLHECAKIINKIGEVECDYSGFAALKNWISSLCIFLTNYDAEETAAKCSRLSVAFSYLKQAAKDINKLNDYDYSGIKAFKAAIDYLSGVNIDGVKNIFSTDTSTWVTNMRNIAKAMSKGLSDSRTEITTTMDDIMTGMTTAITDKETEFETAAQSNISAFLGGLKSMFETAKAFGTTIASNVISGARSKAYGDEDTMQSAGKYLGAGLVAGINAKKKDAWDAGHALGAAAVAGEKAGQESRSPSKATIKAGKWLGEGLIIGMNNMGSSVYQAGKSMGTEAIGSISNSISKISRLVESGIDAQPTIRPVLDLSDVRAGVGAIGSMFATPMGTVTTAGTINTMMNRRGQNGANSEVVSAIDKLSKKLDNVGGNTTYNSIAGITYDDGSNIATAIETIARAAIRERRV